MLKLIIVIFFSCQLLFAFSQNTNDSLRSVESATNLSDTIFYNKKWDPTSKEDAMYYRLITFDGKSDYLVKDYFMNGTLQMEAHCKSINPEIKQGACTYYHPNGKRKAVGNYSNDKAVGVWNYYGPRGLNIDSKDFSPIIASSYDSSSWVSQNQSSLLVCNINYRFKINEGQISSGHGLGLELGFNFGYFISQKLLLAPFVGIGMRDIFYPTRFSSSYVNDFNANFNGSSMTGNDSIAVNYMASIINDKQYYHERNSYVGLMIKLPYKHMPIIKIYTGESSLAYKTLDEKIQLKPYVSSDKKTDNDYFDINRKMNWGLEVFLYNGHTHVRNYESQYLSVANRKRLKWCTNALALSIYVQQFDVYHSHFSFSDGYHDVDVPMTAFMNESFMNKYKKDYFVGLRLSYGIF